MDVLSLNGLGFGLFGLIVGGFLNVLVARWGSRPLSGRSQCPSCGRTIAWYDNIPILSWIVLGARCRHCRVRISSQYPLVEAGTGILFGLVGASPLPLSLRLIGLLIAALLFAIAVYDLRHTIIPDAWVYAFISLSLLYTLVVSLPAFSAGEGDVLVILLSGPVAALPLFALWGVSRGAWMGFGDVKLALGMGFLLGPLFGIVAVFLAFVLGAIVSVPLLFFSSELWKRMAAPYHFLHSVFGVKSGKGYTMKSEVPFGPFLICSCFIIWFLNAYGIPLPLGLFAF